MGPYFWRGWDFWMVAQMLKNLPAMLETQVQSLGQEDLQEKRMAMHSNILVWRIPRIEETGGLHGHKESDTTEWLTLTFHMSMAVPTKARPGFPHGQSLPLGSLQKSLIFMHQMADRRSKNYNPTPPEQKTQPQKPNPNAHMDHSLV